MMKVYLFRHKVCRGFEVDPTTIAFSALSPALEESYRADLLAGVDVLQTLDMTKEEYDFMRAWYDNALDLGLTPEIYFQKAA